MSRSTDSRESRAGVITLPHCRTDLPGRCSPAGESGSSLGQTVFGLHFGRWTALGGLCFLIAFDPFLIGAILLLLFPLTFGESVAFCSDRILPVNEHLWNGP